MKQSFIYIIQLLLLVLPMGASAAIVGYEEHLVNTRQQLPVSAIHSVYRDREGYLWYGTVNGLCRDDGYNLQLFRPDFLQAQDKVVVTMAEDSNQHLWLGTDNSLFWLDKRTYTVEPLCPERWDGERIVCIEPAGHNQFWLLGRQFIALVDSLGHPQTEYSRKSPDGQPINLWAMVVQGDQIYASFADHTLARLDIASGVWTSIDVPEPHDEIAAMCRDEKHGGFWLLYSQGHIYHANPNADSLEITRCDCDQTMASFAYSIRQSPYDGVLWVMNTYGLCGYLQSDDGTLHTVYSSMQSSPRYHMFANVLTDSLFTFVSAFDRPSYMLSTHEPIFTHVPLSELSDRLSFASTIMALAEAGDGWWWIFQERTGVCLIHPESGKLVMWSDFPQMRPYRLDRGRIIVPSSRGVWVNNDERMVVYRLERFGATMQVLAELDLRDEAQTGEIVSCLFEDSSHRLWVGTNMGLYLYQANSLEPLAQYPKQGYVSAIVEDKQGHIWVTTLEGQLCEYRADGTSSVRLQMEPLSALCLNTDGMMWLGTQAGNIYKYNVRAQECEDYSEACGMNGDRVNQLVADNYGHLWIETNQRIIEFNPRNNASHIFKTSDVELPMDRFLPTAMMKDQQGRICFGGIPGVIRFNPSNQLDSEPNPVKTYITDVHVMKQSLLFDDLQLQCSEYIELESDDRDLEIFFSSLDHYNARHVRYAYRLNGVDKDWKYTVVGENSAFYNQLAKGDYLFEVKATDGNGMWSDYVAKLRIHRRPAFYETTFAYVCYVLLLLTIIVILLFSVHKRDVKKNEIMWSDSQEMLQMRNYLRGEQPATVSEDVDRLPESEYRQLDQAFVKKVEKAIREHLSESDFGVEELAAAVNVSKSTLSRKLKSITGQSPLDYIRQTKMHQACLWLQDKDRNVTEIAISLGYSDRKYFTACFKKEFGQTPTEYRREKYGLRIDEEKQ